MIPQYQNCRDSNKLQQLYDATKLVLEIEIISAFFFLTIMRHKDRVRSQCTHLALKANVVDSGKRKTQQVFERFRFHLIIIILQPLRSAQGP